MKGLTNRHQWDGDMLRVILNLIRNPVARDLVKGNVDRDVVFLEEVLVLNIFAIEVMGMRVYSTIVIHIGLTLRIVILNVRLIRLGSIRSRSWIEP